METGTYSWGVPDVAQRLQVSQNYVRKLAVRGLIPHQRLTPTAPFRFDPAEVDAWAESRRVKVPVPS